MFVEKIDNWWRPLFRRHPIDEKEVKDTALSIWQLFFSEEAQFEVSLPHQERKALKTALFSTGSKKVSRMRGLFDSAYNVVLRDMSRSLTNFKSTDMWRAYGRNKVMLESMFKATCAKDQEVIGMKDILGELGGSSEDVELLSRGHGSDTSESFSSPRSTFGKDKSMSSDDLKKKRPSGGTPRMRRAPSSDAILSAHQSDLMASPRKEVEGKKEERRGSLVGKGKCRLFRVAICLRFQK